MRNDTGVSRLEDDNANCDSNVWQGNDFATANQWCIQWATGSRAKMQNARPESGGYTHIRAHYMFMREAFF
jgi:hypothetical protein